jgi:C1A family cysteine protease
MKKYDWKRSCADHRDLIAKLSISSLPTMIDLRANCSPVENQGNLGSCTGHALAGLIEYLELQELKKNIDGPEELNGKAFDRASRLFMYWNERNAEGNAGSDAGGMLRDGIKMLQQFGVCREELWPYDESKALIKPDQAAYDDGAKHKISIYARVLGLDGLRAALAQDNPVVFGFTVFEEFESAAVAATGQVPMPNRFSKEVGGHAVLAVGYDDIHRHVIVRNSWGPEWGDKGYFYLPYDYITNPNLAEDFWLVRK